MRIARKPRLRFGNSHLCEQLKCPRPGIGAADTAVKLQDLADLGLDRVQRIERRHRFLEDDRNIVSRNAPEKTNRTKKKVNAPETDTARGMGVRRRTLQLQEAKS